VDSLQQEGTSTRQEEGWEKKRTATTNNKQQQQPESQSSTRRQFGRRREFGTIKLEKMSKENNNTSKSLNSFLFQTIEKINNCNQSLFGILWNQKVFFFFHFIH
jgi:hypothetical protein